jgi:hypothetical protein
MIYGFLAIIDNLLIFNIESLISKKIYFCICFRKPNVLHHENNDTCFQSCIIIWWSCIYTLYTHCVCTTVCNIHTHYIHIAGTDLGFQVRGAHLKKLRRVEGGAKIFGVCRVKNHDFTPKNHIFSNFRGARAGCSPPPPPPPPPPGSAPALCMYNCLYHVSSVGKAVSLRNTKH